LLPSCLASPANEAVSACIPGWVAVYWTVKLAEPPLPDRLQEAGGKEPGLLLTRLTEPWGALAVPGAEVSETVTVQLTVAPTTTAFVSHERSVPLARFCTS